MSDVGEQSAGLNPGGISELAYTLPLYTTLGGLRFRRHSKPRSKPRIR